MGQERQHTPPKSTATGHTEEELSLLPEDLQPFGNAFAAMSMGIGAALNPLGSVLGFAGGDTQKGPAAAVGAASATAGPATAAVAGTAQAQTTPEEGELLASLRKLTRRPNPEWLAAAQAALGVSADQRTGAMNTPTVRGLVAFRAANGLSGDNLLDDATVAALQVKVPGEPWMETGDGLGKRRDAPRPGADTPKDATAQAMGYSSFRAWQGTWGNATFLGKNVYGHAILRNRVKAADAYMRNRFPGDDNETIRGKLGWDGVIGGAYDHAEGNNATHVHAMGIALDVSAPTNPWIFPSKTGGTAKAVQNMQNNAARLFGGPGAFDADDTSQWGAELSTDEAYAKMAEANEGFRQYLDLGNLNDADLKARLLALNLPASEVAAMVAQVRTHHKFWFGNQYRESASGGFMDMNLEIVRAFRDAGGLAWGAMDWGNENGDTMHFDARTDPVGKQVYDAGRAARRG